MLYLGSISTVDMFFDVRRNNRKVLGFLIFLLAFPQVCSSATSPEDYLSYGDDSLSRGLYSEAIEFYKEGIEGLDDDESLLTKISLKTNLATALSSSGQNAEAISQYRSAIEAYNEEIDNITDTKVTEDAKSIASQSAFFLGMELQDAGQAEKAVEAYGYAVVLDSKHWSALANLGSVLHDALRNHDEALAAYNKAYELLTTDGLEPTDPPSEPRFILSQLQYRIGLCLNHDHTRKCALGDEPEKQVSCQEMATHAFSLAVNYDPDNESAKHMLATVTADATMKRASNTYVKNLFDDYAQK